MRIRYPEKKRASWRLKCLIRGHAPAPAMDGDDIVIACERCGKRC